MAEQQQFYLSDPITGQGVNLKAEVTKVIHDDFGSLTQFIEQGYDIVYPSQLFSFLQTISAYSMTISLEKSFEFTEMVDEEGGYKRPRKMLFLVKGCDDCPNCPLIATCKKLANEDLENVKRKFLR